MAFIKFREVTKYFNFSKAINRETLPKYVKDYIADDEIVLAAYKTHVDYGVFTNRKILLFDSSTMFGIKKQISEISYKSFSSSTLTFFGTTVELNIFLDSGYPLKLKFIGTSPKDKTRIRWLFYCMNRVVDSKEVRSSDVEKLSDEAINSLKY